MLLKIKSDIEAAGDSWVQKIDVKAAFLNFYINVSKMAEVTLPKIKSGDYFNVLSSHAPKDAGKVMIEFSQPNTHKEFHVGHGRNVVVLGDSIVKIYKYNGYDVMPVNYIGDEGTHVAKCLWQIDQYEGEGPSTNKAEWYGERYVEANNKLKDADEDTRKVYNEEISKNSS